MRRLLPLILALMLPGGGEVLAAPPKPTLQINRVDAPITIDGDLSDASWQQAARVENWFETNPSDNTPARTKDVGWLAYDNDFFYAGFEFEDPDPAKIRAPFADRDDIHGGLDYAGVILDTRHTLRTAILFLASPRGIQYDAVTNDATGNEDAAPDFFWDSAAKVTERGWTLEIRIPFSSLRYEKADPQTWGILLYRNFPRDFRYQHFSAPLPRESNCFICNESDLLGLAKLPEGGNWVVAPYATTTQTSEPEGDLGTSLDSQPARLNGGIDAKWTPNADTALDATINPDFSQIESDVAQIAANERFALFFPEKRPFFLESVDLYATPLQAVYTRSIADPKWGGRGTGRFGDTQYTALVTEDQGGGSVIIPGANNSSLATLEQGSTDGILRVRHDLGKSFVSLLATARELTGQGHNRVLGPDFQWSVGGHKLTGQYLYSSSQTPNDPAAAEEWDGRRLSGHAGDVWYTYNTEHYDAYVEYRDIADAFRADLGFLPQVGIREGFTETGWTFRPTGFFSRVRPFVVADRTEDRDGALVFRMASPGVGTDFKWNGFARVRWSWDRIRAQDGFDYPRRQLVFSTNVSPSLVVSRIQLDGAAGEEIDFATGRTGHGLRANLLASFRPGNHLELQTVLNRQYLDVPLTPEAAESRLFTATVARLRGTYTFNRRAFLRLIVQDVDNEHVEEGHVHALQGSALFSYKLNWQSVLFLGYGDDRIEDTFENLQPARRSVFLKLSYAFQG
ncbi:MAG TPA: DUF5916 domain-containing protein [Candidatus Polarisedimenticolaceae bacterium]|nr:DUF5916 domain-containing protein [Candidatus Polarisedimenticolaceae bacterium]